MAHQSFCISRTIPRLLMTAVVALALAAPGWGADKAAPDFNLKDVLTGKDYSVSQFKGKVVVINFFTFFCGPCRDEMPDLNKINNELKGKGLQTLGIALSSDPTQIRFLVKQLGLEYPVLIGNDKVSDAYGSIAVVPTTVIIDKQGNIVQRIEGTRKKAVFTKLIEPLL
jgi:cytochrome c biogenesis protein CcmG, thiol:disulfide interchange protein DsbE